MPTLAAAPTFVAELTTFLDFTRALFSADRCGLLELVPSIPADQLSRATVRDGLLGNLTDAEPGTPAGDHPVMELAQTMPDDDLTFADGARLDPLTCELTTACVSAIAS